MSMKGEPPLHQEHSHHSHISEEETTTISNKDFHPLIKEIKWRKYDNLRLMYYFGLSLVSGGFFLLFCFLYPNFKLRFLSLDCSPQDAEIAVVVTQENNEFISPVERFQNPSNQSEVCLILEADCIRFIASNLEVYTLKQIPIIPVNFSRFLKDAAALSSATPYPEYHTEQLFQEYSILIAQYGYNKMKVPESTFMEIGLRHLLSPFYLFQYFAVIVWYVENYWLFASLILIITMAAVYFTTKESVHNLEQLRQLVGSHNTIDIINFRGDLMKKRGDEEGTNKKKKVITTHRDSSLVPGDIFLIKEGMILPCDAILISGKVLVDESMLTGESIPVCKVPMDRHLFGEGENNNNNPSSGSTNPNKDLLLDCRVPTMKNPDEDYDIYSKMTGNILFSGTKAKVLYGEECYAIVYKTSFRSAKGQLVASLLKPKEGFVTFISDAVNSILFMLILVTIFYIMTAYVLYQHGLPLGSVIFRYLDAISIAVPPALTACLTISTSISIERLKEKSVYVADTTRLNFAGVINAVCFDKTGTLTESNLQFLGVYCCTSGFQSEDFNDYTLDEEEREEKNELVPSSSSTKSGKKKSVSNKFPYECQLIMATCHSLAFEKNSTNPIGDPLEVELYQASQWSLHNSTANSEQFYVLPSDPLHAKRKYDIYKHFEFTPERLRAASIVSDSSTGKYFYLLKGSPEVIMKMCLPSTLPKNINEKLSFLSCKGYRVIALASKECLESEIHLSQTDIETNNSPLLFYGLVYLSSTLKKETKKTIRNLKQANIHVNMITGDHINTAIAVAEDCGIIKPMTNAATKNEQSSTHSPSSPKAPKIRNPNSTAATTAASPDFNPDVEYITYIIDEESDNTGGAVKVFDMVSGEEIDNMSLVKAIYLASKAYLLNYIELNEQVLDEQSSSFVPTTYNPLSSTSQDHPTDKQQRNKSSKKHVRIPTSTPDGSPSQDGRKGVAVINFAEGGEVDEELGNVKPTTTTNNNSKDGKIVKVQLAITGKALRNLQEKAIKSPYYHHVLQNLVHYAKIFARMKPHDKKAVVEILKECHQFEIVKIHYDEEDDQESTNNNVTNALHSAVDDRNHSNEEELETAPMKIRKSALIHDLESSGGTNSKGSRRSKSRNRNNRTIESLQESFLLKNTAEQQQQQQQETKEIFGETLDVLFCGDGANDMVALRAATIGVSLCDSETSVAAPITSKVQSPFSVISVLLEGRCSLITAYVLILFTLEYGCIQLFFTLELYYYGLIVGDYMYIIQDLFYTLILGYTMCKALPSKKLSIQLPPKRFLIAQNISKFFGMIILFFIFQLFSLFVLNLQGFYHEYETDDPLTSTYSYESSVIFNISLGQVMIASIVSSIDEPFRQSWTVNYYHTILLGLEVFWLFLQIFIQDSWFFQDFLAIKPVPIYFGFIEIAILILHLLLSVSLTFWIDWLFLVKLNKLWFKEMDYYSIKKSLLKGTV
jgi:predicted P-type ATPase